MTGKEKSGKVDWPVLVLTLAFLAVSGVYGAKLLRGGAEGTYRVETALGRGEAQTAPERVPVNVNTATVDQLQSLTGIGPALAQAIVDEREANGPFETLDELLRVRGIGQAKLEALRSEACVGEEDA